MPDDKPVILNPSGDDDRFPYRLHREEINEFLYVWPLLFFGLGALTVYLIVRFIGG